MKHKLSLIVCLTLIMGMCTVVFAGDKEFKISYEKYLLPNGLNILLHVDRSDPIAAVYVIYHVGSARESKGRTGFAHLFEHLRFNESQNIPQGQWFKKLQTAGAGSVNGSTGNDRTNYFEVVPKNALEMALWMESDRMGFLLSKFTQETFVTQQNVVQNEKRQYDNRPYSQGGYIMDKLLFPADHPYNWQVIGELEDLANASLQDAIDFHNNFYGPNNATLVVSGDIDVAQTKEWIEKYFGEIKPLNTVKPQLPQPAELNEVKKAYYEDNLATAPELTMAFPTIEDYTPDSYALSFFARIFAGSKKSPLYKVIVEEKKLAPSVQAYQNSMEIAGNFQIAIRTFPDKNLGEVEAAIKEAFERFEKEGFTDKDVERQKAVLEFSFYNSISSVLGKAMRMADYNIFKGSPDYISTDFNNTLKVTSEDIRRVYNKYIKGRNYAMTCLVPTGKSELAAPGSKLFVIKEESIDKQGTKKKEGIQSKVELIPTKFDRTHEPVKGVDPVVKLPEIWTGKMKNEIPVYGIKHSELPLVNFMIMLKGGMLFDSPDKVGTASLTARMLNEGTKTKTAIELREAIQDLGASINIYSGPETITLYGSCLTSKMKEAVDLAKEMLLEPRWDEKEFAIVKNQALESLKRNERSPNSMASLAFNKLVYGNENILSNQPEGNTKSIDKISIDDLKNYYTQYFSPSAAKIMVVGDINQDEAISLFDGLNEWQAKEVTFPEIKIGTDVAKPGIYFIDVPNAKQSELRAGHLSLSITDPDYYKLVIMNHKLGGDFNGILNMILREQKAFTYGARSSFSMAGYPGCFAASTSVQTNSTLEALQIIKDEISKYRQGISPEDLEQVKSTLLKSYALRFETLNSLAQMLAPIMSYNLPLNYVEKNESVIQNMTPSEEKQLAEKYLQPDKMIYVIVGDKATQFEKLKSLGLGDPILLDKEGKPIIN